jgi:hypothetical protein
MLCHISPTSKHYCHYFGQRPTNNAWEENGGSSKAKRHQRRLRVTLSSVAILGTSRRDRFDEFSRLDVVASCAWIVASLSSADLPRCQTSFGTMAELSRTRGVVCGPSWRAPSAQDVLLLAIQNGLAG